MNSNARHDRLVPTMIEAIDRILSEGDPLVAKLKAAGHSQATTDSEFTKILKALDRLENRAEQIRVELK